MGCGSEKPEPTSEARLPSPGPNLIIAAPQTGLGQENQCLFQGLGEKGAGGVINAEEGQCHLTLFIDDNKLVTVSQVDEICAEQCGVRGGNNLDMGNFRRQNR